MQIFIDFHQVGVSVLVASHDLNLIEELAKPVLTLNQGKMIYNDLGGNLPDHDLAEYKPRQTDEFSPGNW
jgi:cell division transport system ATP-binding protein